MNVDEMKILRWISENVQKDMIQNEEICLKIMISPLMEDEGASLEIVWPYSNKSKEYMSIILELIQLEGERKGKIIIIITLVLVKNGHVN